MTSTNFTIDNINPLIQVCTAICCFILGLLRPSSAVRPRNRTRHLDRGKRCNRFIGRRVSGLCRCCSVYLTHWFSYSNGGTFTLCTTQGSSATFVFNGTQVFVNGAKRSNHGPYSITLDGTQTLFNGFSENAIFGPLFVSPVLAQGQHTVTLTNQLDNTSFPFLDLDFITWTSTIPDNGESKSIEDTDSSFAYNPPSSWGTDLSTLQLTGFSSNNGHTTQTTGASVTGTFISIFGPVGPHIAPYTVQLDGVNGGIFNATKQAYYPQVALYSASGLADGPHTLELISQPSTSGQALAIDYVQVSPSSTPNATTLSGDTTSTSIGNKSRCVPWMLSVRCQLTLYPAAAWARRLAVSSEALSFSGFSFSSSSSFAGGTDAATNTPTRFCLRISTLHRRPSPWAAAGPCPMPRTTRPPRASILRLPRHSIRRPPRCNSYRMGRIPTARRHRR
ncbi:hypothetical protein K438DRAFT_1599149 [Mycena galopus ATCC 62051]|nr:hypothetical protein K438DRAFT_1599149 [Mycena galopus ATCC 62051]